MISNILHYIKAIIIFLPFILFQFFNKRANLKKENRHKQYIMPVVSVAYFIILFVFINSIFSLCESLGSLLDSILSEPESNSILSVLKDFFAGMGEFIVFMAFNIIALMIYTFIKKITFCFLKRILTRIVLVVKLLDYSMSMMKLITTGISNKVTVRFEHF